MDDIEKIRRVLISRKCSKLADLLIHSEGELSKSSTYGHYLFSTISTYYIKSPPKETDLLNALSEIDKRKIFDAVISVYPYKDHAPEIVNVEYQISFDVCDDDFYPETPAIRSVSREYISNLSERALDDVENGNFDSAITKSRTLLEEVFCFAIEKQSQKPNDNGVIDDLYKQVKNLYNMHQDSETDKRINDLLSGLNKIIKSISLMRNKGSDAHGLGSRRINIKDYHARLFVNSARTVADFILAVVENKDSVF